jgi:hypothetical protein
MPTPDHPVTCAVITGGHSYDVPGFHRLFRGLPGVDAYIQHMDDFASSGRTLRQGYDVVVFYNMLLDGPTDEGLPWYAGQPRTALDQSGETTQGLFILHHALLAYPRWPAWTEMVGIADRSFAYYHDQQIRVEVTDPDHPITRGLSPWGMTDETYAMMEPDAGSRVLLEVHHELSMRGVGWTRQYRRSPVFCLQLGHDSLAWENASFREVVRRGILWCAGRL